MSATHPPAREGNARPAAEDIIPPVPDEDGPHDVPDEEVIENTLPTKPIPEGGGRPA